MTRDAPIAQGLGPRRKTCGATAQERIYHRCKQVHAERADGSVRLTDRGSCIRLTAPAGKYFMPNNDDLARIGIRVVVYPQEILAATVHAIPAALTGPKGGTKPVMAASPELAAAIRLREYLAPDE